MLSSKIPSAVLPYKRDVMADKCQCLIPDEDDNCIECGQHLDFPEMEPPDLGDIMGIIRLIDTTAKTYEQIVRANADPNDPTLPRMRIVGNTITRIPHKALYKQVFGPTFQQAKRLGYKGTFQRWTELLQEAVDQPADQPQAPLW
jgi:hypothetical protein